MLLGIKYDERENDEDKEWKGHFVAGGHNQTDVFGVQVIEDVAQTIPSPRGRFVSRSRTKGSSWTASRTTGTSMARI